MLLRLGVLLQSETDGLIGTPHALSIACRMKLNGILPGFWARGEARGRHHSREDAMKAAAKQQLDPSIRSTDTRDFQKALRAKIVGQDEGVQALVDLYQVFRAGLNSPGRPVGNLLFLGPTGSGKTRIVESAAEILFGDARAVIKVDCAEFQHSHEIAKLIGSPPGYLGHRETHPLITQEALAASHRDDLKLSFLLFDEIEKASDSLWQLLLGMLDKATLTLGDNRRVDLSQTVIFLTSNLGGVEITELMDGGFGFVKPADTPQQNLNDKVQRTAVEAARRKFSPEFMNRLDKVVVFHPLHRDQLEDVLDIELTMVQQRVLETARGQFLFRVTEQGRDFLLQEGTDQRYGARHLKRAIERHVVYPMANLLATEQVHFGDMICIDRDSDKMNLSFVREGENVAMPVRRAEPLLTQKPPIARGGRPVEAPGMQLPPEPAPRFAR
jgi:ATP-dependent Clp protease ATP-binding subunit ClpA